MCGLSQGLDTWKGPHLSRPVFFQNQGHPFQKSRDHTAWINPGVRQYGVPQQRTVLTKPTYVQKVPVNLTTMNNSDPLSARPVPANVSFHHGVIPGHVPPVFPQGSTSSSAYQYLPARRWSKQVVCVIIPLVMSLPRGLMLVIPTSNIDTGRRGTWD